MVSEERRIETVENPEDLHLGKYQILKPLTTDEYEALKERIAISGIEEMVKADAEYNVIDGHHRVIAWTELLRENRPLPKPTRVEVMADLITDEQKIEKAFEFNGPRRHLDNTDKIQVTRDLLERYPQWSNGRIAGLAGVQRSTVARHRERLERLGVIKSQAKRIGADGIEVDTTESLGSNNGNRHSIETRSIDRDVSVETDVSQKSVDELVVEKLAENPELSSRIISEQTGATLWFVDGIRERLRKQGVIPGDEPTTPTPLPEYFEPRHREPGALKQLEEAGIVLPPPPMGKTHEEKVYDVLVSFRDTMLGMPSDPKEVARSLQKTPLEAVATHNDFGQLIEWLEEFHEELGNVAERAKIAHEQR